MKELYKIVLKKFPTHVKISRNKKVPDRYMKVNGQNLYNGKLNPFARAIAMDEIHKYVIKQLKGISPIAKPIYIEYTFRTVINHGDIRRIHFKKDNVTKIIWKKPKEGYKASYDLDNMSYVWIKGFQDSLEIAGIIEDDTVDFVQGYSVNFERVEEFDEREIVIKLYEINKRNNIKKDE